MKGSQSQFPVKSSEEDGKLNKQTLEELYEEIRRVYCSDSRPWVIGFSGGKDSTTALQLIWLALVDLPRAELKKPVYIISSDTLVESPVVVQHLKKIHENINRYAQREKLPFRAEMVYPLTEETFWVNMIGKGYPAPSKRFRWCTDRLKIQPANRFIMDQVATYGEVVLVLGVRRSESITRAQVMSLHKRFGDKLSRHSRLTNAWVYTPIEDWSVDSVWSYLLSVPSPWGGNNHDLVTMYKNAQAGECPLVVDTTTPSCGNSRFGCWTCTVVDRDKTMEAMIDNGEEWLEPLLELRDWLSETQNPETKINYREPRRRDGKVHYWGENQDKIIWGPYKLEFRKEILRRVLAAQSLVRKKGPDPNVTVIGPTELHEIRRIWRVEEGDWEDSVPKIYREATGEELNWSREDLDPASAMDEKILIEAASKHQVPSKLLMELVDLERRFHGMARRSGIYSEMRTIFDKNWEPSEEILSRINLQDRLEAANERLEIV